MSLIVQDLLDLLATCIVTVKLGFLVDAGLLVECRFIVEPAFEIWICCATRAANGTCIF